MFKGERIEVKDGELRLPPELERFDEIERLGTLTNLKKLHYKGIDLKKIEHLDQLNN